jgi:hypothetical protein
MKCLALLVAPLALACNTPPPPSQLPNAQAAIDRMRATGACGNALQADAKLDYFASESGRARLDVLFLAKRPASLRMDALAPLVGSVFTLATDGKRFQVADKRNHRFLFGPATQENIARVTHIPMPLHPFVTMLMGRAPVLKHDEAGLPPPTIAWSGSGYYVVRIPGNHQAVEEIHLVPTRADWKKPWSEQRLRVVDVAVWQQNVQLYHVELDAHDKTPMSPPSVCDDVCKATGEQPTPLSGPQCEAELPRRIHVDIPPFSTDVLFRYDKVVWNPPIDATTFVLQPQPGLAPTPL